LSQNIAQLKKYHEIEVKNAQEEKELLKQEGK
jgi:hypothetical protein